MSQEKCSACKEEFAEQDQRITGNDHEFHEKCFKCHECKRRILSDEFYSEVEFISELDATDSFLPTYSKTMEIFCLACSEKSTHSRICYGCKERFEISQTIVRACRHCWHPSCFVCQTCRSQLNEEYFMRKGKAYCIKPECNPKTDGEEMESSRT